MATRSGWSAGCTTLRGIVRDAGGAKHGAPALTVAPRRCATDADSERHHGSPCGRNQDHGQVDQLPVPARNSVDAAGRARTGARSNRILSTGRFIAYMLARPRPARTRRLSEILLSPSRQSIRQCLDGGVRWPPKQARGSWPTSRLDLVRSVVYRGVPGMLA